MQMQDTIHIKEITPTQYPEQHKLRIYNIHQQIL